MANKKCSDRKFFTANTDNVVDLKCYLEQILAKQNSIANSGMVTVSENDNTLNHLQYKLIQGTGITLTVNNDGANESITISNANPALNFLNGLTKVGSDVKWGGTLTQNTVVNGDDAYSVYFPGLTDFIVEYSLKVRDASGRDIKLFAPNNTSVHLGQFQTTYTGASGNVSIGYNSMRNINSNLASANVAIGHTAGNALTSGSENVYVGYQSGVNSSIATKSIGIGVSAGGNAFANVVMGYQAMASSGTTGARAVAIGYQTLYNNNGYGNTAVGYEALNPNTSGELNVGVGIQALWKNTTGYKNTAIGAAALEANISGNHLVAVGYDAMYQRTGGAWTIGIGWNALFRDITGSYNIGIGTRSGAKLNGTSHNIFIGHDTGDGIQKVDATYAIALGDGAYTTKDYEFALSDLIQHFTARGFATGAGYVLTDIAGNGELTLQPVVAGSSYTFQNGITEAATIVKLGGVLTEETTIDGDEFDFHIQSTLDYGDSPTNYITFSPYNSQALEMFFDDGFDSMFEFLAESYGMYATSHFSDGTGNSFMNLNQEILDIGTNKSGVGLAFIESRYSSSGNELSLMYGFRQSSILRGIYTSSTTGSIKIGYGASTNDNDFKGIRIDSNKLVYLDVVNNDNTKTNLLTYDTVTGLLNYRTVASLGGGGLSDADYGDITVSSGGTVMTIDNGVVTYAKMQNVGANSILGRVAGTSGVLSEIAIGASQLFGRGPAGDLTPITLGTNLSITGTTLNAAGGGGTPGGSNKQFQWNNSSSFAGSSNLTQETDQILITGTAAAAHLFKIVGAASQSGNFFEIETSTGTDRFIINSVGRIQIAEYIQVLGTDVFWGNILGDNYNIQQAAIAYGVKYRDNSGNIKYQFDFGTSATRMTIRTINTGARGFNMELSSGQTADAINITNSSSSIVWGLNASGKVNRYGNAAPTDGQILIGHTANGTFEAGSITAGTGISVTPSAGGITIAATGSSSDGTWTPTLTNTTNIGSSSASVGQYTRVGNTVTFSVKLTVTPTAETVASEMGISLPVASNFANDYECAGAGAFKDSNDAISVLADTTNDRIVVRFIAPTDSSPIDFTITGTYKVI